jgi:hypothetical protein
MSLISGRMRHADKAERFSFSAQNKILPPTPPHLEELNSYSFYTMAKTAAPKKKSGKYSNTFILSRPNN